MNDLELLFGAPPKPPPPATASPQQSQKKGPVRAKKHSGKDAKSRAATPEDRPVGAARNPLASSSPPLQQHYDTSLLTTKEKTKYGTYLTDEAIEQIRMHAIHRKRDDHQIVQEAINQYLEGLKK